MNTKRVTNNVATIILVCFFASILLCMATAARASEPVLIAVAANMQVAMEAIEKRCEEACGVDIELIIGSSGALATKIRAGAPFHIYMAANTEYPEELYDSGYALFAPRTYARGKLVAWSCTATDSEGLHDALKTASAIAVADPQVAPYGKAAMEAIKKMGLAETYTDKYVYGRSISQVNHFIISGGTPIGFTSLSTVKNPALHGKGVWIEIDETQYSPIRQASIIVKTDYAGNEGRIEKVYAFIFSKESKKLLEQFGYAVG